MDAQPDWFQEVPYCSPGCPYTQGALGKNASERPIHCHGFVRNGVCVPAFVQQVAELRRENDELHKALEAQGRQGG